MTLSEFSTFRAEQYCPRPLLFYGGKSVPRGAEQATLQQSIVQSVSLRSVAVVETTPICSPLRRVAALRAETRCEEHCLECHRPREKTEISAG